MDVLRTPFASRLGCTATLSLGRQQSAGTQCNVQASSECRIVLGAARQLAQERGDALVFPRLLGGASGL
jgi:hypothetical protein